jgi:enamine deaminase RidA (YjgF/YER057c/UK114 family)
LSEFYVVENIDSSQAVQIGQTLYLSGSIGLDPKTGQFAGEGVREQARQVN